jgi:uncharacterized RDD family membrane protein YckC
MERYHTILRRLAAWLIDLLFFLPAIVIGGIYYRYSYGTPIGYTWAFFMLTASVAYSIYFHGRYGATPGKSWMKCRVVSHQKEEKIGFRAAVVRESPWIVMGIASAVEHHWARDHLPALATVLSVLSTSWSVADDVVALCHPKKRALHDLIAGTVVVREEPNQMPVPMSGLRPAMAHR